MTYPDDEALTYSYEASLFLDGVQSSIDSLNLVSSVSYKDIGLPDSYTLGSGAATATQSFEYWKIDDTTRSPYAALKRTKLTKGTTDLVNREMQYDAVGNVTKTVDSINSETIDYTYDELDRLLTASVPSGESFVYNTIGNMTSKSGATLDYGTTSPKHGVKTYGSASYTYDANGSMTAKGDLSIKYDPERRPVRVQDSGTIYRVVYDGDGVRRKRLDENGTIHYLGDYERNVGNGSDTTEVVTKYYYASLGATSRLIAFRRAGELYWAGTDHLGGTIRVMDSSFAAVDGMRYEPYGEDRDTGTSLNTDRKFTGQTEDESIGLYWYQSRAYDPEIGRFCSPDVVVPDPLDPQSLNRYSYVYNNPLKYTDPSGHFSISQWFWEILGPLIFVPPPVSQEPLINKPPVFDPTPSIFKNPVWPSSTLVTEQEDLNSKTFVQTGPIGLPTVYETQETQMRKRFEQKARKGPASPMGYGQTVHREHEAQAGPGEQANVAIRDREDNVARQRGTGKIGRPDRQNPEKGYMVDLKVLPPWVADEDAHEYLDKTHGPQARKYMEIAEQSWGIDIILYWDTYRVKD